MPKLMDAYRAALDAQREEYSFVEQLGAAEAEVWRARRAGDRPQLRTALQARTAARQGLHRAVVEHDARFATLQAIDARSKARSERRAARKLAPTGSQGGNNA